MTLEYCSHHTRSILRIALYLREYCPDGFDAAKRQLSSAIRNAGWAVMQSVQLSRNRYVQPLGRMRLILKVRVDEDSRQAIQTVRTIFGI